MSEPEIHVAKTEAPSVSQEGDTTAGSHQVELPPREPARVPPLHLSSAEGQTDPGSPSRSKSMPTVPGYEIVAELGRGGMGVVYQARQLSLNRLVALKMIRAGDLAGPQELARFRNEAEAVARLKHPNIVQIYEVGECDGRSFFSLEYVDGGNLAQRIKRVPQPPQGAAEFVETLARAVHAAHQCGIVHRDLKPANILLSKDLAQRRQNAQEAIDTQEGNQSTISTSPLGVLGALRDVTPKIADFGLAKRLDTDAEHTRTGTVMGTPSYMAPEQAAGKTKDIGPATDVYALGAILYELLTGRPPFVAESWEATRQLVLTQETIPPRRLQPKLPRDLQTICLKCLAKEPNQRYASAHALADDLKHWQRDEPISARPETWSQSGWRSVRRHPIVAAALALLVLTVIVAPVVMYFRDPARQLERIQGELAKGQRVELIGETGKPSWCRWRTDEAKGKLSTASDGTFRVQHLDFGLLELLPDPIMRSYRFRAEVRHEEFNGNKDSEAGIYFGHKEGITIGGSPVFCYFKLSFNDMVDISKGLAHKGPQGNPVGLFVQCHRQKLAQHQDLVAEVGPIGGMTRFAPVVASGRPGLWRKLAVEVATEQIRVCWDGRCISQFQRATLVQEANDILNRSTDPIAGDMKLDPNDGLGLYVRRGAAACRHVVVEPLDE